MNEQSKIMEKLENAYVLLQNLDIQPTKTNMEILMGVLTAIQAAHDYLGQNGKQGEPVDDPE